MMMEREKRLRTTLDAIASHRAHIRQRRLKSDLPTVAVVGYTNAGKKRHLTLCVWLYRFM